MTPPFNYLAHVRQGQHLASMVRMHRISVDQASCHKLCVLHSHYSIVGDKPSRTAVTFRSVM